MIKFKSLIFALLILSACQSEAQLQFQAAINTTIKEASAGEIIKTSPLIWTVQDSGNENEIYGLNQNGAVVKTITISNAKNTDWEDLTSDSFGNLYIGDFGNNNHKRKHFEILKIKYEDLSKTTARVEHIRFKLPKKQDTKDLEAFFLWRNFFYIFSKESKVFTVFKVKNETGEQKALKHVQYNLEGKDNKITAADISDDGSTVVLLNHDKLWKLSNYTKDDFFSGDITKLYFNHNSQKEGVAFRDDSTVIITDERKGLSGGNINNFKLK